METGKPTGDFTAVRVAALIGIGLASGFFAGLFGIGGGILIVPALVVLLKLDHRKAVGTSLLAILPAATISAAAYWVSGSVDLVPSALLAVGAVVGAQFGAWLLTRISRKAAQWVFVVFLAVMVVQLLLVVPDRGAQLQLDPLKAAGLLLLGLVAGTLSAVLGIGGGGVVVPILMVWFGLGDLAAKGASLVMMLPGVISGIVANARRGNLQVKAGLLVGLGSLFTGPLGAWVAHLISAQLGAWLFAAFLVFIGATMVREALRPAV
ncbi:sulfite exporter TauE/SafE family protein [Propionicimonas sp.]|uniref:sulfite exporter TauE/SafE family protein n=1 Tax=Propionicimonas sp. TaxID=1955623 RepID=UPI0017F0DE58|nr:sulfite exporter TauE/SafE family protein [Propionicimonas sp.]MBU3976579.1 sulfite exporter TauE/SafE family protein [Actinomycetota bacterium]MBA3020421.1 sulfite exporter TauE/SafE family protein [Propionicimonas sp.]MBU3986594.1 sulfite exporter TauE/SafE family protein [Actinomycetota bacterium]MBU4007254.1 sulfite exporter TauE/SafE family protein [Actinomycetota bacterium]MBU4065007.1 sulfite exporter TauE/SafE family protein [Actinomycetota bacterium]